MAVTASIFRSSIFKCVIKVFSLVHIIIKSKYYIGIYGSMIYRSFDTFITLNAFTQKSLMLRNNK